MFDPYRKWLAIPPKDQPPNYYRLLSVELFENDLDAIEGAADRAMGFVRQYQSGEHAADAARILSELATARLCLLKAEKKAEYDAKLRKQLAKAVPPSKVTQDFADLPLSEADLKPISVLPNRKRKSAKSKSAIPSPVIIGGGVVACLVLYFILNNGRPAQIGNKPIESQPVATPILRPSDSGTKEVSPPAHSAKSPDVATRDVSKTSSTPNDVSLARPPEPNSAVASSNESPKASDAQPVTTKTEPPAEPRKEGTPIEPVILKSWQASLGLSPPGVFSQNSSQFVYGIGTDVVVAKTETGESVAKLTGHKKAVWIARFSSDDRRIVSIADDALRIWDATTHKVVGVIKGKNNDGNTVLRANSDASRIVFSTANDRRLVGLDGTTKTELGRIELTEPEVTWKAVSSDLKWGLSNGIRNQSTFWNLDTRDTFQIDNGHHNYCGYFTQDGTHALLGGEYRWEFWDLATKGKTKEGAVSGGHIYAMAMLPQRNRLMAGLSDGTIWMIDTETGQNVMSFKGHDRAVGILVVSPDEKHLISQDHHNTAHLWRLSP